MAKKKSEIKTSKALTKKKIEKPITKPTDKPRIVSAEIVEAEVDDGVSENLNEFIAGEVQKISLDPTTDFDNIIIDPDRLVLDEETEDSSTTTQKKDTKASKKIRLPVKPAEKSITTTDPLQLYMQEIRRYPLLTKEEEIEISKKYFETKDAASAQKLIQSNLRFVVKIAAEYSKFGSKMIDLIQEGNIGLMHAVKEYNPYKGARLITYAVWWIRGYIQEYLMKQYSLVRIGTTQNQRKLFYQLQKHKEIMDSVNSEADLHKLSEQLGIPEDEVQTMAQRMFQRDVSLDKTLDDESSTSLGDLQKNESQERPDQTLERLEQLEILKEKIEEIRPQLNPRELILLEERILNDQPLTLQEIGEKYGITREAVRQMEARLIKKIQQKMLPTDPDTED
ncbi:MAG: RNA polymerase factor sigma-32 [Pseudobdellovibrionaceae bacterium]